jgi:hypothetical protein
MTYSAEAPYSAPLLLLRLKMLAYKVQITSERLHGTGPCFSKFESKQKSCRISEGIKPVFERQEKTIFF